MGLETGLRPLKIRYSPKNLGPARSGTSRTESEARGVHTTHPLFAVLHDSADSRARRARQLYDVRESASHTGRNPNAGTVMVAILKYDRRPQAEC